MGFFPVQEEKTGLHRRAKADTTRKGNFTLQSSPPPCSGETNISQFYFYIKQYARNRIQRQLSCWSCHRTPLNVLI